MSPENIIPELRGPRLSFVDTKCLSETVVIKSAPGCCQMVSAPPVESDYGTLRIEKAVHREHEMSGGSGGEKWCDIVPKFSRISPMRLIEF
jgi:hypothetical protein